MTVMESFFVALLCISIVMLLLACLFIIIRIFSFVIGILTKAKRKGHRSALQATVAKQETDGNTGFSSGELKLHNVDERTAAMIMAIVSDESGIPLSELCFKSIKAIENKINDSQEATA